MNKSILRLAIPNILSNLSVPLLSVVDTALMGHMDSATYLGGIALGASIFNILYWAFGFLRMGTTGLTAQAYGMNLKSEMHTVFYRGIIIAGVGGLTLILLQIPLNTLALSIAEGSPEVKTLASQYFFVRIWAAPATIGLYVFNGWFLGMQNARTPMILTIAINLFNIGLNLFFVKFLDMDIEGVAWGTVFAQYLGLGMAIFFLLKKYPDIVKRVSLEDLFERNGLLNFGKVNLDILIRTLCLIFTMNFIIFTSGEMGDQYLAVNSLLLLLNSLMAYGVDGFAFAAESIVGNFLGARDWKRLNTAIKRLFVWGIGGSVLFSFIYAGFGPHILSLFTDKTEIINAALLFLPWMIALPLVNAVAYIWDGIYIGATASRQMRNVMIVSTFFVFLPCWYFSIDLLENHGIWLAFSAFMLTRALAQTLLWKKTLEKIKLNIEVS